MLPLLWLTYFWHKQSAALQYSKLDVSFHHRNFSAYLFFKDDILVLNFGVGRQFNLCEGSCSYAYSGP